MTKSILFSISVVLTAQLALAQNISYDKEMGAKYSKQVEESMGVYDDAQKTAYVNKIGQRLVTELEEPLFDYQFKIIPTSIPNAFALPGGYLYVTTGLIPLLENEDELACIMAHEIIHSNNRHSVKSQRKGILPAILQIPGNILGAFSPGAGAAVNAPIQAISGLGLLSYSRKQETEADVEGVQLAAKAGYDPEALKGILTRLSKTMELQSGEAEKKSYLSDHPYTPDRVEKINKTLEGQTSERKAPVSDNFLMEFNGILAGDDPSSGVIDGTKFYQPSFNFSMTVPDDWEIAKQGNMVAGGRTDQNAALYCSYEVNDTSAEKLGKQFLAGLSPEYKKVVMGAEAIDIDGKPGYIISFRQTSDGKEVYGFRIWMNMSNAVYQFYGIGYAEYREKLEQIVYSVKPLTAQDKSKVTYSELTVVNAQNGETIKSVGQRTNNVLDDAITAVVNNHAAAEPFVGGEPVKVVQSKPYFK